MTEAFITIAEAVQLTGKSRRTIQRLVEALLKNQPDQVMKEKTPRGYIWRLSEQSVQQAYGVVRSPVGTVSPVNQQPAPASPPIAHQPEKYLEVVGQGYAGMMTMHQEVKQIYEERLKEKNERIFELNQALKQAKKGFWARVFGD
jgi:hypothetical protein